MKQISDLITVVKQQKDKLSRIPKYLLQTMGVLVLSLAIIFAFYPIIKFFKSNQTSQAAQPILQRVSPAIGAPAGGDKVILQGSNFQPEQRAKFKQISAGNYHTCAIALDNQVYCWGNNNGGQLGNGTNVSSINPVAVSRGAIPTGVTLTQIFAGDAHTCALASNNRVYCWGYNNVCQLGNNSTANSNVPVAVKADGVLSGKTIKQVSVGEYHTCVIASDDKVYCWGRNTSNELGDGNNVDSNVPVAVKADGVLAGKTIKQVSAGAFHTCAIASDNKAYCWGNNGNGQLGSGASSSTPVATSQGAIPAGVILTKISAGHAHTCVLASNNKTYCWGG